MNTIWTSTVTRIGSDAADMLEAGVVILFGEPVPPALTDVSVVHEGAQEPTRDIAAGDTLHLGDQSFTVDAVGEIASKNLRELGHVVVYVNQPDQELLPGAVKATGDMPVSPTEGATLSFLGA